MRSIFIALWSFVLIPLAQAQATKDQSLEKIRVFARDFCDDVQVKTTGSTSSVEVSGAAKVKLTKMLKFLADAGVEGAAKFSQTEFDGLLQQDIVKELVDRRQCRIKIFEKLVDRLKVSQTTEEPSVKQSQFCSPLGRTGICMGMTRQQFSSATAGMTLNWQTKGGYIEVTLPGSLYGLSGSEVYSFTNDLLVDATFAATERYQRSIDYKNERSTSSPLWVDTLDSETGKRSAVDRFCDKAKSIGSSLTGNFGAPIEGPAISTEDISRSIREQYTCRDDCTIGSASATIWRTRFKGHPKATIELYVRLKDAAWDGQPTSMVKYSREQYSCALSIQVANI